jgi:hypothetical protein
VTILALVLVIIFMRTCNGLINPTDVISNEPEVVYIKEDRDSVRTVNIHTIDTFYEYVYVPPKILTVTDTVFKVNDSVNTYHYGHRDDTLEYNIYVDAKEVPEKVTADFTYLRPTIHKLDSVADSIFVSTEKGVRVNQVYYGVSAVVYPGFSAAFVGGDFVSKKGWQFEAGAGVGFSGDKPEVMGLVGVKKLLTFRKKK